MSSSAAGPSAGLDIDQQELLEELQETVDRARLDVDEDELLDQPARLKRSTLPEGKLPGFGEPEDDCGELIPEAMHWCDCCYDVKELPHNCYRYDCPMHGLHAVRRRAAGARSNDEKSMDGAAAKLGAIRATLDARLDRAQVYHHLSLSPPRDYFWRSDNPLERGFQLCREIMDTFGGQGIVVYHPYRSKEDDDRGFWKDVLGHGYDWPEVRKQLIPYGHFHVVCAAPKGGVPGGDVTRALEASTGWILERHTARDSSVSVFGDEEMARALTYTLSHALVYTASDDSRRLAARWKGPDVNSIDVYDRYKSEHRQNVFEASRETLGLAPPNMECNREVSRTRVTLPPSSDASSSSSTTSSASRSTDLPKHSNVDATGEVIIGSSSMAEPGSGAASTPTTSTTTSTETCGGRLRHISQAGEVLPELVASDVDVGDLDAAYRAYDNVMKAKGLDGTHDARADIPEFEDRPPPD